LPIETTETRFGQALTFGSTLRTVDLSGGMRAVRNVSHLLVGSVAVRTEEGRRAGAVENYTLSASSARPRLGDLFTHAGSMTSIGDEAFGDGSTYFAEALAMSGNIVVVGARRGGVSKGRAFVFDATSMEQTAELIPDPRDGGDHDFGAAVDVSGDRIVVGYPSMCTAAPRLPCATELYIYKRGVSGTLSKQKLTNPASRTGIELYRDDFGAAVAISENMLWVGERYGGDYRDPHGSRILSFIHDAETDSWSLVGEVEVPSVARSTGPVADRRLVAFAFRTATEAWVDVYNGVLREARIALPGPAYAEHIDLKDERLIVSTGDSARSAIVYRRE
jgi:hypothetical protein